MDSVFGLSAHALQPMMLLVITELNIGLSFLNPAQTSDWRIEAAINLANPWLTLD